MASLQKIRRHIGFRYLARFACIGAECEDDCCGPWQITVDEGHFHKIKRAMSVDAADREKFRQAFLQQPPAQRRRESFALLAMRETDRRCTFFGEDRLCGLQNRLGAALLPDTCAVYPRMVGHVGDRLEMAATLSCPEVARLALLDERATDLVNLDPRLFPRGAVHRRLNAPSDDQREAFDNVRGTLYEIVSLGAYPLASRLFIAACFAERIEAHQVAKGAHVLDPEIVALEAEMLDEPDVLDEMHHRFQAAEYAGSMALTLLLRALASRAGGAGTTFRSIFHAVMQSYIDDPHAGVTVVAPEHPGEPTRFATVTDSLFSAYQRRRAERLPVLGDRLDIWLANYCKTHLLREWYITQPSLLFHLKNLFLRVAMLRFLLLSHGALAPGAVPAEAEERRRLCDRTAVSVFYSFSRELEHNQPFLESLTRTLEDHMPTLKHSLNLLQI